MRLTDGVTEKGSASGCWTSRSKRVGVGDRQIRFPLTSRRDGETSVEERDPRLPRKASMEYFCYPYRKPTQVDEERILR